MLARHRRVLRRAAGAAPDREAADLRVDVELEAVPLELLREVDVETPALGGDRVRVDADDPVHRPHVDDRPAVRLAAVRRRVPGAAGPHGRRVALAPAPTPAWLRPGRPPTALN